MNAKQPTYPLSKAERERAQQAVKPKPKGWQPQMPPAGRIWLIVAAVPLVTLFIAYVL